MKSRGTKPKKKYIGAEYKRRMKQLDQFRQETEKIQPSKENHIQTTTSTKHTKTQNKDTNKPEVPDL